MKKNKKDLKILLLQIRHDIETCQEEYLEFVEHSGLTEQNLFVLNPCKQTEFNPNIIDDYDALFVGGSSDATVMKPEDYPFVDSSKKLVRYTYEKSIPVFASCFGFQSLVRALGGELVYDPASTEVGTFELELTEQGKIDPLLGKLPARFDAQMGHKDRAASLADGVVHLASSRLCTFQALRIPGKPIWATQFHPELDRQTNLDRYRQYLANYGPRSAAEQAAAEAGFRESPDSSGLLTDFLDLVFS